MQMENETATEAGMRERFKRHGLLPVATLRAGERASRYEAELGRPTERGQQRGIDFLTRHADVKRT
jgi:hypothetical protein